MDQGQTDVALRATEVPMLEPEIVRQIRGLAAMSWGSKRIAATLGLDLNHSSAGGGSDANFTGPMDLASLDGLGVRGAALHTLNEHIFVDSLAERGRLMAGLYTELT